jgi:mediator of RNA polymerase II transcription subunit 16
LLPVSQPLAGLVPRLTVCRTIAWSKWGSIASITPGGATLELRNLRCSCRDGTWGLSEPTLTPPLSPNNDGGPLKHLCWSPTGSELAVIDAAGRVAILSLFSSLNKPTLSRHAQMDPVDDLHGVVGCYWLNLYPYPQSRPVRLRISVNWIFHCS